MKINVEIVNTVIYTIPYWNITEIDMSYVICFLNENFLENALGPIMRSGLLYLSKFLSYADIVLR